MSRLSFLPLAVLVALAGCATQRPAPDASGPYAGIPAVAAREPIAEAQPVVPTGDDELDEFLGDLAAAIDRHDWRGVARTMEPEAFGEQRALIEAERASGAAAQVIGETLGLGDVVDYTGADPWRALDRIQVITLRQVAVNTPGIVSGEQTYSISGDVRLDSGQTLTLEFTVASRGGAYVILVPLG